MNPKIWKVKIENYKAIAKVIETDVEGKSLIIRGENGAGKSSFLGAIWTALTGKDVPDKPIAEGQDKAHIEVEIDRDGSKIIVRKEFRKGQKPILIVSTDDKARYSSPQKFLDEMIGNISFDPFSFIKKSPLEQKREVERILGIDLSDIEKQKKEQLDRIKTLKIEIDSKELISTEVNSEYHSLLNETEKIKEITKNMSKQEVADEKEKYEMLSKKKVALEYSIDSLRTEYKNIVEHINENNNLIKTINDDIYKLQQEIIVKQQTIETIKAKNEEKEKENLSIKENADNVKKTVDEIQTELTQIDYTQLSNILENIIKLESAEKTKETTRKKYNTVVEEIKDKNDEIEIAQDKIKKIEKERTDILTKSHLPIEGIDITENGITYNGLLLSNDQISKSEIIIIGMKLSIMLNPGIRMVRIDDWNQIDKKNKELILSILKEYNYQLFAEEVTDEGELQFVIIDETKTDTGE